MVILWETYFKCLALPDFHIYDLGLEILKQASFAEQNAHVLALAAVEWLPVHRACVIDRDSVPELRRAPNRLVRGPLLAHDLERAVDLDVADRRNRLLDRRLRDIP